jgi:bifunctional UDP-N-acetylglucosamine pyrophosphorylase/glucosamine-1-phosphate N-acetyltransferase
LLANENAQGEYYLPDVVELLCKQEKKVDAVCFNNGVDFQGVNSPIHLSEVTSILRTRILNYWMDKGVKCADPASIFVGPRVKLEGDIWIDPFVQMYGDTSVGEGTRVGSHSLIRNSKIGRDVNIINFVSIASSEIEDHAF